jgi:hypothetical protein
LKLLNALAPVLRQEDIVAFTFEQQFYRRSYGLVVIDDLNPRHWHGSSGMVLGIGTHNARVNLQL